MVRNVTSVSWAKLLGGSRFEAAKLDKRLIAFCGELPHKTQAEADELKKLCGGDLISMEEKNKTPMDVRNFCKLISGSNAIPEFNEKTEGLFRRLDIIDFKNQFNEQKSPIYSIPDEEFEAIGYEVLKTAKELIERGTFSFSGTIDHRRKRYEERANPFFKFLEDSYVLDSSLKTPFFEICEDFELFCQKNGFRTHSRKEVSFILADLDLESKKEHVQKEDKTMTKWVYYFGIGKKPYVTGTHGTHGTQHPFGSYTRENPNESEVPSVPSVPKNENNIGKQKPRNRNNWIRTSKIHTGKCLDCGHDRDSLPYCEKGQELGCYCSSCFLSYGVTLNNNQGA